MTDLELRNENGTIVAYDRESGNKIPLSIKSLATEKLSNTTGFTANAGHVVQGQVDRASWGRTQLPTDSWTKYTDNVPLFQPSDVTSSGIFCADVFAITHEGNVYLIYEYDNGDSTPNISISESPDGKTDWTHHPNVIADSNKAQPFPHTIHYNGAYYAITNQSGTGRVQLWKTAYADFPTGWSEVWDKKISSGISGAWDEYIKDPGMVFKNGKFWLVYAGGAGGSIYGHIGAKFTAGSNIENPTFQQATWSGMKVGDNIQGFMPVQYGSNLQFFVHTRSLSTDLALMTAETFTRSEIDLYQHPQPPIAVGPSGAWDDAKLHHIYPIRVGDMWHAYYDGHSGDGNWKLGLATLPARV